MNIIKFYKNLSKTEKRNINLGLCYLVVILTILLIIFFKFTDFKVLDIELIKSIGKQTEYFVKKNFILSLIIYGFFIFFWVMACGFMSPVILLGGYLFGNVYSTLLITFINAISATIFFFIFKTFYEKIFQKIFKKKFQTLINFLNQDSRYYFLLFRILGGFGTPSPLQNIIPIFIKINFKEYFFITLLGTAPLIFIWSNFGSSLKILTTSNTLNLSLFSNPEILVSLIGLALLSITPVLAKKIKAIKK